MTRQRRLGRRSNVWILFACTVLLSTACSEGLDSWRIVTLKTDVDFRDVHFLDDGNGWMVGGSYQIEGGLLAVTHDGGLTWTVQSGIAGVGPRQRGLNLNTVVFFDAAHGLIAGDRGVILKTTNGGKSWRFVHRGPRVSSHLFNLHFIDSETGWAVGTGGIYRTDNGGDSWRSAETGHGRRTVSGRSVYFLDESTGFLVGQHGRLARSDDGGATWHNLEVLSGDDKPYLWDVFFLDELRGWVVGERGTLLVTRDAGETWRVADNGSQLFLTAVRFTDQSNGWITGYRPHQGESQILRTHDGGKSWSIESSVTGAELRAMEVLDAKHAWAIGNRARPEPQKLLLRRPQR